MGAIPQLLVLSRTVQWMLGLFGLASFVTGVVAVFLTDSSGTGVLLTIGAILIVFVFIGNQVANIEVAGHSITFANVREKFEQAELSELRGDVVEADRLREDAWKLMEQAASEYWKLRSSSPSSYERTAALESVMARAEGLGAAHSFDRSRVNSWLLSTVEANRAMALAMMKSSPDSRDVDAVLSVISKPKSAFEQYHALLLLEMMFDGLPATAQSKAIDVISSARGLTSNADQGRNKIRQRILERWSGR